MILASLLAAKIKVYTVYQFLYICSNIATAHLAMIFYKKMEQIYKNRTISVSLINSAFDIINQKIIW